jgi:hypothetical protein
VNKCRPCLNFRYYRIGIIIYQEYQGVPSSELASPAPSPASECVPPLEPKGGVGNERGVKRRRMETQRVQMKAVLPWLVRWARHAGTRDFYPALAALVSSVQNIFPHSTLFQLLCPHRTSGQAVVQGPPVSEWCLWGRVRGEPIRTTGEKAWHSV